MIGRVIDFLLGLKDVHVGEGTRFGFVFGHMGWMVAGVLVVLVVGYLTYVPQSTTAGKKRVLGILRGVLLAVVLLLACRPELVMEHEDRQPAVVAVWVDSSASMTLEDPYSGTGAAKMHEYLEKVQAELAGAGTQSAGRAGGGRLNRYQLATAALKDAGGAGWLKKLTETQQVLFFTGSGRAEPVGYATNPAEVDARMAQIAAMKPAGNTTDVPTVVRDILERVQGRRLSGMVLLTDGQTTETASRLDEAASQAAQGVAKVFSIPVGQEEEPFDLRIASLRVPKNTFTKDPVSERVRVAGTGITGPTAVRINIYREKADGTADRSAALASREVTLDKEHKEVETDVPVRLEKTVAGSNEVFKLVTRIEAVRGGAAAPEERTLENNEVTRTVKVLDAQINVLYVEGYPRWEYRYLTNELIREPTVNVSTLLLTADEGFKQDSDPPVYDKDGKEKFPGAINHFPDTAADLALYDVLLIGDVEPTYFSPLQQSLIVDWVKTKGGGVCFIAGNRSNPELYRGTPLEALLPVTPDEVDPRARIMPASDNTPYEPMLTAAGKETNLFRFFDEPEESWKQVANLPAMYWYKPVQGLKPGSIVLAMNPKRVVSGIGGGAGGGAPLLVTRQFGAGPVLFSAYCDTWRWRRYTGEPLFQSYWLQLCRYLYANKAMEQNKRMELTVETPQVELGGSGGQIKLSLTVKDPTLNGQLPPEVPVMVVDKEGRTVQTITLTRGAMEGEGTGGTGGLEKLTGSAAAERLGDFTLQVKPGVLPVEVEGQELTVGRPQREFENVTADMASLQSLAKTTGGDVIPPYRAADVLKEMPDRSMMILQTQSEELWNKPFALVLVLAIATAEWLLRKRAGLI
jgi:hypothetical protein